MTRYHVYDCPTNGTTGQDCGAFALAALPERLRAAIAAEPNAGEWTLPALSGGDHGEALDDLTIRIVAE